MDGRKATMADSQTQLIGREATLWDRQAQLEACKAPW